MGWRHAPPRSAKFVRRKLPVRAVPDLQSLLPFATASIVLLVIPGPTTALVVARSIAEERRVALLPALALVLETSWPPPLRLAGAGALLAASATVFTVVKRVGAAYLVWLGIALLPSAPAVPSANAAPKAVLAFAAFRDGFPVTVFKLEGIPFLGVDPLSRTGFGFGRARRGTVGFVGGFELGG